MQTKADAKVSFTVAAAGQVYKHPIALYGWAGLPAQMELSAEITWRLQRTWSCFQRYKMKIHDRLGVRLRLKVRMLKAQVMEMPIYRCLGSSLNQPKQA